MEWPLSMNIAALESQKATKNIVEIVITAMFISNLILHRLILLLQIFYINNKLIRRVCSIVNLYIKLNF